MGIQRSTRLAQLSRWARVAKCSPHRILSTTLKSLNNTHLCLSRSVLVSLENIQSTGALIFSSSRRPVWSVTFLRRLCTELNSFKCYLWFRMRKEGTRQTSLTLIWFWVYRSHVLSSSRSTLIWPNASRLRSMSSRPTSTTQWSNCIQIQSIMCLISRLTTNYWENSRTCCLYRLRFHASTATLDLARLTLSKTWF